MSHAKHEFTHIEIGYVYDTSEKKDEAKSTHYPLAMVPLWGKLKS